MADSPPHERALRLRYSAMSDVGRHRKENQDSGYASEHLLVVADGVGGAAYGDVASATAVHLLRRLDEPPTDEMLPALAGAVHRIHDKLAEMVEQDDELDGTSTTVTAALFDGSRLGFAHVGDSRAYLYRGGEVRQVTKDHTFVQTLVDEGRITEADSRVHPHRNIILRAVDGAHDTEPDLFHVELEAGDRILLCSDGCSGAVTDEEIGAILRDGTVDSASLQLVQAALENGTTDNVTVVVAEVVADGTVDDPDTNASSAVGPMLVGAAASQPRRGGMLGRALFRGRQSDTGELDPVPDEPPDPEELRYAPQEPRKRGRLRRAALVVLPLLLIAGVLAGAYTWSQNQYYVAVDGTNVAIYKGVQMDLPGVELSTPHEVDDLRVTQLSPFNQRQVEDGIVADDLADARRIVQELAAQVQVCEDQEPEPTPGPTPRSEQTGGTQTRDAAATQGPDQTPSKAPGDAPRSSPTAGPTDEPTDEPGGGADDCVEPGGEQ